MIDSIDIKKIIRHLNGKRQSLAYVLIHVNDIFVYTHYYACIVCQNDSDNQKMFYILNQFENVYNTLKKLMTI